MDTKYERTIVKISQKLKFEINQRKEFLLLHSNYYDENLVVFEGGLGSQILSYFELTSLLSHGVKPKINFDYFANGTENKIAITKDGGGREGFRPWSLDRYGITISQISSLGITKSSVKRRIPSNLLQIKKPDYYQKYLELNQKSLFAINEKAIEDFLIKKEISSNYYAIHLRRGDYLKVASKLVSDEEVFGSISKLLAVLPIAPVLIVSDSSIDGNLVEAISEINSQRVIPVDPDAADEYLSHDLLRKAKVLVTSNSTFSLSAALLARENQLTFLPLEFYTGYREEPLNLLINKLSKFSILI